MDAITNNKHVVATHEAGHVMAILVTPISDYILNARLFLKGTQWQGEVHMDTSRDRRTVDPHNVYELAKGIAGPLAQIHFYPESIPNTLRQLIHECSGLLSAAKKVQL